MIANRRRLPRFSDRAQTLLDTHRWPEGFTVKVDMIADTPTVFVTGLAGYYAAMPLDPYELYSADPARVVPAAVKQFRAQAACPAYTEQRRQGGQASADALEASIARSAEDRCPCWEFDFRLGHGGHCCFLRDGRRAGLVEQWRPVEEICHTPTVAEVSP